jgi:hypothetical protein
MRGLIGRGLGELKLSVQGSCCCASGGGLHQVFRLDKAPQHSIWHGRFQSHGFSRLNRGGIFQGVHRPLAHALLELFEGILQLLGRSRTSFDSILQLAVGFCVCNLLEFKHKRP